MKENKVYTKTGDDGTTGLFSGKRVPKHHIQIQAYGSIDELIAWLGLLRDFEESKENHDRLVKIQEELMVVSTQLSLALGTSLPAYLQPISMSSVVALEQEIDRLTDLLPPLKHFVIPGGNPLVSYTHLARCVCRKAERDITALNEEKPVDLLIVAYVNRLSDYLFTLSRKFAQDLKVKEIKWNAN